MPKNFKTYLCLFYILNQKSVKNILILQLFIFKRQSLPNSVVRVLGCRYYRVLKLVANEVTSAETERSPARHIDLYQILLDSGGRDHSFYFLKILKPKWEIL